MLRAVKPQSRVIVYCRLGTEKKRKRKKEKKKKRERFGIRTREPSRAPWFMHPVLPAPPPLSHRGNPGNGALSQVFIMLDCRTNRRNDNGPAAGPISTSYSITNNVRAIFATPDVPLHE